jgi:hypothetical protein
LENENIYRSRPIKIPKPDFIVLYNGDAEYPDKAQLNLSDVFKEADIPNLLELTVQIYNINKGRNKDILQKSKSLSDYAAFVGQVKENRTKGLPLDESIKEAVNYCINNNIMKDYLKSQASEVRNMLLTEFNMNDAKRVWREEGREEGMEEGMEKGALFVLDLMRQGYSLEEIEKRLRENSASE